jgi:hypothetical protein
VRLIEVSHRRLMTLVPSAVSKIFGLLKILRGLFFRRSLNYRVVNSGYCHQLYRSRVDKSFYSVERRLSSLIASGSITVMPRYGNFTTICRLRCATSARYPSLLRFAQSRDCRDLVQMGSVRINLPPPPLKFFKKNCCSMKSLKPLLLNQLPERSLNRSTSYLPLLLNKRLLPFTSTKPTKLLRVIKSTVPLL